MAATMKTATMKGFPTAPAPEVKSTPGVEIHTDCSGSAGCQIGDLFGLLSQAHMMDVLHLFITTKGPVRFNEVQAKLLVSPNTLSARLKSLVEAGLLTRTAFSTIPPRVDYEATAKARDLGTVFGALGAWAKRHSLERSLAA